MNQHIISIVTKEPDEWKSYGQFTTLTVDPNSHAAKQYQKVYSHEHASV